MQIDETTEQAAFRRAAYAQTEEGARLIDAMPFVPPHIKPQLLGMIECFRRWSDG